MFKKLLVCLLPLVTLVGCNKKDTPYDVPLYITNLGGDAIIQYYFDAYDESYTPNVEYSPDRKEWETLNIVHEDTTDIVKLSKGETIYFRGNNPNYFCHYTYSLSDLGDASFNFRLANPSIDTKLKIGGNVMSLLSTDNYANKKDIPCDGCFNTLFYEFGQTNEGEAIGDIDASDLLLPATELKQYAYYDMFDHSSISKAPLNLPATNSAQGMYEDMFQDCENLITAPIINLNNLSESSCNSMFDGCSNLDISKKEGRVKIFTCPADTSEDYCVEHMFASTKHGIEDPKSNEEFYYN